MVRPASFGFNGETAANNHFQDKQVRDTGNLQEHALQEFDAMVRLLRKNDVEVLVMDDTEEPPKPDAIFPNNWFSCKNGLLTLFPMYAGNRRAERRTEIIDTLREIRTITKVHDLSGHEKKPAFLEGTGSMVCDHQYKIIYACLSERTDAALLEEYAALTGYATCLFSASDKNGREIYHTNVMMCIGEEFAVVCTGSIKNETEKNSVTNRLESTGHQIVNITPDQMNSFAGNMLQLTSKAGVPLLLMSKTAHDSLTTGQLSELKKFATPLVADVPVIERAGGGSVRCMVAEIF
jgi:hypothetical protein